MDPMQGLRVQQAQATLKGALSEQQRQGLEFYGKAALAVDEMPDGPQKQAAWQRVMQRHSADHPGEQVTPEEMDYRTGPKLMAAQAGQYLDPRKSQMIDLNLEKTRAETKALQQKDVLSETVSGILNETLKPSSPAASQEPRLQPQSYNGQAPQNPLLIQTAEGQPQAVEAPSQNMVDTPLGQMPADKASKLGFALALGGKGEAGKMFNDPATLGRAGTNENDKNEIAATNQMGTLNAIKQAYDAKFLNIPNRFKLWGSGLISKFGQISPKDSQDLKEYTEFRQSSWHNLNRVLKDLSGTAVTENEMQRQLLDQPNPGQGIADGDYPKEFETKLKGQLRFATSAIARARYLRNKGFKGKPWEAGIGVDDMPRIINDRGQEIEQQLRQANPKADPMDLQQETARRVKQEFGI